MTPSQRKRTKELMAILAVMGGRMNGHNCENYERIADITRSSKKAVQAWLPNRVTGVPYRIIPALKLDVLRGAVK